MYSKLRMSQFNCHSNVSTSSKTNMPTSLNSRYNGTKSYSTSTTYTSDKTKITGYHDLPQEILVNIFRNFTEDQLIQSIIPVCQNWKYAALHPLLWKKLVIKGQRMTSGDICQKLRLFTKLENVCLKKIVEPVIVLRQVVMCSKKLKKLSLRYCNGIKEYNLRHLVRVCQNLEVLDLKGTEFKGSKFYQDLPTLKKLKSINLSGNKLLTKENILTVALNCHQLEEFILSHYKCVAPMTESEWSFIITSLSGKLKSICMDGSAIGDRTFYAIMQCPFIENVGFCSAFNLTGDVFLQLVNHPMQLKALKLRFAHLIDAQQFSKFFTEKDMSNLHSLDLTGCWKITDDVVECIGRCNNLRQLNLRNCKRITSIDPVSENCLELKHLNIAFCNNLNLNLSLLSLPKLEFLFINEDSRFETIVKAIMHGDNGIKIKVCLSEYNKGFQKLN